jgi:iron complex outermembrane receptor protein
LAPAIGGIFDLNRNFALYASYVKSLEETGSAPINSKNAFDVLPPASATQKEVGIRAVGSRGFAASFGYFTIDRANATTDPVTQNFGLNGRNFFQGLESTVNVKVTPRWTLSLGGQEMNATQHSPHDPTINGKTPENVPKLSGNVGLAFEPRTIPGLQLSGGLQFVGARQLNPQDQGTIPSVTTSSFGVTYTKKINDRRVSINLSCRNCGDKRYWSSAVNGALGIASPRTVSLSVRLADIP